MRLTPILAAALFAGAAHAETVTIKAADGVTVYGEAYFADLPDSAPLISLFHQAGANGRGEYSEIAEWLNGLGYRAIAWDQRSGGGRFGSENRTAKAAKGPDGFCDAYPDVEAGLAYAHEAAAGAPLVIWGSSYSASLVWRAAADHADKVDAVAAFSTATGGQLDRCGAKVGLPGVEDPGLAVWPDREARQARKLDDLLTRAGATTLIVDDGVHGSSSLVDSRTGEDMSKARSRVAAWLAASLGLLEG